MDFYYDSQIRRYLLQFERIFTSIKYRRTENDGTEVLETIPMNNGNISRNVASILNGNTQNAQVPIPSFSSTIVNLRMAPERRANPTHESAIHYTERKIIDGAYTSEAGNKVTVERYMGVPYDMTVELSILTSNMDTRLQILEQILTIFNPSLELQQTDSFIDWTSIFYVELEDINWEENFGDGRFITTLSFNIQIWINPPAKIKRQKLIHQVVTNIKSMDTANKILDEDKTYSQCIVTPGNCSIDIFKENGTDIITIDSPINKSINWKYIFDTYGTLVDGVTKILLIKSGDIEDFDNGIVGYVKYINDDKLEFIPDELTLPDSTYDDIISTVDPNISWPGNDLKEAEAGDRYIFISNSSSGEESAISNDNKHWGINEVDNGTIVEYNGQEWLIDSIPTNGDTVYSMEYETLITYNNGWEYNYHGTYMPGLWRIMDVSKEIDAIEYIEDKC